MLKKRRERKEKSPNPPLIEKIEIKEIDIGMDDMGDTAYNAGVRDSEYQTLQRNQRGKRSPSRKSSRRSSRNRKSRSSRKKSPSRRGASSDRSHRRKSILKNPKRRSSVKNPEELQSSPGKVRSIRKSLRSSAKNFHADDYQSMKDQISLKMSQFYNPNGKTHELDNPEEISGFDPRIENIQDSTVLERNRFEYQQNSQYSGYDDSFIDRRRRMRMRRQRIKNKSVCCQLV